MPFHRGHFRHENLQIITNGCWLDSNSQLQPQGPGALHAGSLTLFFFLQKNTLRIHSQVK